MRPGSRAWLTLSVTAVVLLLTGCDEDADSDTGDATPSLDEFCQIAEEQGRQTSWEEFDAWFQEYRAGTPTEMGDAARADWESLVSAYEGLDAEDFEDEIQWDEWFDSAAPPTDSLDTWEDFNC